MTGITPEPTTPRPSFRLLMLMPWRWSRWALSAPAFMLPFAYFLSALPMAYFSLQLSLPARWNNRIIHFYHPVWWCRENSKVASLVIDWEDKLMVETFGNWNYPP